MPNRRMSVTEKEETFFKRCIGGLIAEYIEDGKKIHGLDVDDLQRLYLKMTTKHYKELSPAHKFSNLIDKSGLRGTKF